MASSSTGHDRRDRLGRLAVEPVRKPLAQADRAVGAVGVVAQLGEHRRRRRPAPCDARAITNGSRSGRTSVRSRSRRSRGPARAAAASGAGSPRADPRQRVHAPPRSPRHSASPPKRTGSSHGSPVSAAVAAMTRRASSSSAISEVLSATATTFDGATRPATASWVRDERPQRRDREPAPRAGGRSRGRPCPGLWTMTMACGVAPWISPSVTLLYAGWSSEPWPSTMHPVAARLALLDQPLHGALEEVRDDPVDGRRPSPRSSSRSGRWPRTRPIGPPACAARRSSSATDILPIAQSVPTVSITRLPGLVAAADGGVHALRRPPVVDQPDARRPRGLGELRVVAEERVQAGRGCRGRSGSRRGSPPASRRGACRRWARCRSGARSHGAGTRARR